MRANELGENGIGKLLVKYSVPAITATAAASLYNIIDRIFIGQGVGAMAISGLALTFPLMNIMAAFGAMIGVGSSTMVSIRLGRHDRKGATLILGNAVMLNMILSFIVSGITFIFLGPILSMLGGSEQTIPYAKEFMQIILIGNLFNCQYLGMNGIMRASGYPTKAMVTTLITVGVNLMLAPVFIFVFGWGIRGAAFATVLAQIIGTIWVVLHFSKTGSFVHFLPGYMKLKKYIVKDIVSIGLSNFIMLFFSSIITSIINISLKKYGGDYAVGAYGILNSLANLVVMVVIGFNQGMQPIVGYNFGAHKIPRLIRAFKLTVLAGTCVTTFGFILGEFFPTIISSAFTSSDELIKITSHGMRLTFIFFPIIGFQMVTSTFFQSIKKVKISIFLSLSRQVLFLIPALLILPGIFGIDGVWLSSPVADSISTIVTFFVLKNQIGKLKKENGRPHQTAINKL